MSDKVVLGLVLLAGCMATIIASPSGRFEQDTREIEDDNVARSTDLDERNSFLQGGDGNMFHQLGGGNSFLQGGGGGNMFHQGGNGNSFMQGGVPCQSHVDLIFILDSSGSIGADNWSKVLEFCNLLIDSLDIGRDKSRVGMLTYGNSAYPQFELNAYNDKQSMMSAVLNLKYMSGGTNTVAGIRHVTDHMFTASHGDRSGVPNIAVVVTDGASNSDPIPEANRARDNGATVIAMGIGNSIGEDELAGIGGEYTFKVAGFDVLDDVIETIAEKTCGIAAGGGGNSFFQGGAGNSFAQSGGGNSFAQGGDGNSFAQGGGGNSFAQGGGGNSFAQGGDGNSFAQGGGGNTFYQG